MRKLYISVILLVCALCTVTAQNKNLTQARKLYSQGKYAQAKPMFEKLLKKTPDSGELNYWYAICCLETGPWTVARQASLSLGILQARIL